MKQPPTTKRRAESGAAPSAAPIRKRRAAPLEQEVFLELWRRAGALVQEAEELLKPHRLSASQYNVLRIVRGAGEDGLACRAISERMVTRDPDVTRLLDRLEEAGLVERSREKADRRVVRVRITAEGRDLLARLDEPVARLHVRQLGGLGKTRLRELSRLLQSLGGGDASRSSASRSQP